MEIGGGSVNTYKIQIFRPWGQVGVSLFVMITGYFLSENQNLTLKDSWKRNCKLWIKTVYYSWIILILTIIFSLKSFSLKQYIFAVFPVVFDEYWFISSYIVLVFLIPMLNWLIHISNKKSLLNYIGIIVVVTDIMPYIQNQNPNAPLGNIFSTGAMLAPYLIAAYIRKYHIKIRSIKSILIIIIGILLEYISVFALIKNNYSDPGRFTGGILPLFVCVGIFVLFLKFKPFYSRIINWIASGVLASYLITEHPLFRLTFWHQFLNVNRFQNPLWMFVLMGILISIITVLISSVIDHFYQYGYNKLIYKLKK